MSALGLPEIPTVDKKKKEIQVLLLNRNGKIYQAKMDIWETPSLFQLKPL